MGGGDGVQKCNESGASYGDCIGCEGSATDSDSEGREPDDSELDECDYTTCIGDICSKPADCCATSACGSWIFTEENGFSENYCYPICDPDESDPCKCDDACLDFQDGLALCLPTGSFTMQDVPLPVRAVGESIAPVDSGDLAFSAEIGGDRIPVTFFFAYWFEYDVAGETDRELVIRTEGESIDQKTWMILIYVPDSLFQKGPGQYPLINDDLDYNFFVEIYSAMGSEESGFSEVWLESLISNATFEIGETCAPCAGEDVSECEACVFSADVLLFGMKSKLDY